MPDPSVRPILSLRHLHIAFSSRDGVHAALHGVDFDLFRGRTLALVGESGSGKTLSSLALLGLGASPERWAQIRGNRIAMVCQEPIAALNPVVTVGAQLVEALVVHRSLEAPEARARILQLLSEVGVPEPETRLRCYAHELSGGLAQRVMIAMALACEPEVIIADEPTTALDVTIQAQILALLKRLQHERQTAMLFVTHDLALVSALADEVAVMYAGRIVEHGPAAGILKAQRHPYTRALWHASLAALRSNERLVPVPGIPPGAAPSQGCAFAPRCSRCLPQCAALAPELHEGVACFAPHDDPEIGA